MKGSKVYVSATFSLVSPLSDRKVLSYPWGGQVLTTYLLPKKCSDGKTFGQKNICLKLCPSKHFTVGNFQYIYINVIMSSWKEVKLYKKWDIERLCNYTANSDKDKSKQAKKIATGTSPPPEYVN